jgi:hypothetical protein
MLVVLSTIIVWELFVFLMAMLFGLFNLRVLKTKKVEIQLGISILSAIVMAINYVVAKIYEITVHRYDSYNEIPWYEETGLIKIYLIIFLLILGASIYKYINYKKGAGVEDVFLKKDEYVLHKDFDLTLNDYIYLPNVKKYAIYGDNVIVFSSEAPDVEVDATFILKKLDEKVYECIAYESRETQVSLLYIFNCITSWTIIIAASIGVVVFHLMLGEYLNTPLGDSLEVLAGSLVMYIFGMISIKLIKGTKGIISIIELVVGVLAIAAGVSKFVEFISMVF